MTKYCGVCRGRKEVDLTSWAKRVHDKKPGERLGDIKFELKTYPCPECSTKPNDSMLVYDFYSKHPKTLFFKDPDGSTEGAAEKVVLNYIEESHIAEMVKRISLDRNAVFVELPSDDPEYRSFKSLLFVVPQKKVTE